MSATLASLRKLRRISQLELSLRTGVSQRHLSCIETGRAGAGRETLIALLDALGANLPERNQALLAAGYAQAHAQRPLDAPEMAPVRAALTQLLEAHDSTPAMVLDGEYNLIMANAGLRRLLCLLGFASIPEARAAAFDLVESGAIDAWRERRSKRQRRDPFDIAPRGARRS